MSWEARIHRVTDHVRTHLTGDLTNAELAKVAHASPFHFSRLFKAIQGETPNQYVRRARLEHAIKLMRTRPEQDLADIAASVGLGSSSNFTRVFKATYGMAPSRWDRKHRLGKGVEGFEDRLAPLRATCPPFRPVVREHAARRIAYVRVATPFMDKQLLASGYDELTRWFEDQGVDWRKQPLIGLSWDNPESTPLDQVRFDLGFSLPDGLSASGELGEQAFPALRSVDVHVQGHLGYIALAWEHLYERWLPTARSEPANFPGIKRFRKRPDQLGWETFDLDCSIALRSQ